MKLEMKLDIKNVTLTEVKEKRLSNVVQIILNHEHGDADGNTSSIVECSVDDYEKILVDIHYLSQILNINTHVSFINQHVVDLAQKYAKRDMFWDDCYANMDIDYVYFYNVDGTKFHVNYEIVSCEL